MMRALVTDTLRPLEATPRGNTIVRTVFVSEKFAVNDLRRASVDGNATHRDERTLSCRILREVCELLSMQRIHNRKTSGIAQDYPS